MKRDEIIQKFHQGHCLNAYDLFGAHYSSKREGVKFTVYAPHATKVQVVGNFNDWSGVNHQMKKITDSGIYSLFIAGIKQWDVYKYEIFTADNQSFLKADPYAFYSETRPATASKIVDIKHFSWHDRRWLKNRSKNYDRPVSIYEVHAGGWKKHGENWYTYRDLADNLIPYVKEQGFTHIELMPLNEHPFDGSWGYQAHGYYSLTSRYGNPEDFAYFVDQAHLANIGVILDVVPVHFVKDSHGLRCFDGQPVYEYQKESDANSEWGTCNFDLWKEEVRSFLMSSIAFWLKYYHLDGIRMDAIANLIFWGGNKQRGINQGALDFCKRMNYMLTKSFPSVMLIAEDSSDYPQVTQVTIDGGLGFDYKWDLGWMNDTLKYYQEDPINRKYHHNKINFSMAYFYSERFLLPLSHDEVVHGKGTVLGRMWGSYDQQLAQLKNLYLYMFTHPGKKLNFMGNELAGYREFDENRELDWNILQYPKHDAFARFFRDMNKIYQFESSLSSGDYDYSGFHWIDADNAKDSVYSYYRENDFQIMVCLVNMTPNAYENFRVGVPQAGEYIEVMNTEKDIYSGCNMCNFQPIQADQQGCNGQKYSLNVRLAPFAGVIFKLTKTKGDLI